VNSIWQIYSIVVHLSFYRYKILLPQYTLLTDYHRLLLYLKLHTSNFMVIILITLCRVCLVLNTSLTHGTHDNTNLIRKLLFASLQAIVTHIKVISAFIPLVKKKNIHIKTCDVWWIIFFSYKDTLNSSTSPPISYINNIFSSWLSHIDNTL
jgi:hypothetical protein